MEREQRSEKMKVKDPRSEEETAHASDLINLILVSTHTHIHILSITMIMFIVIGNIVWLFPSTTYWLLKVNLVL